MSLPRAEFLGFSSLSHNRGTYWFPDTDAGITQVKHLTEPPRMPRQTSRLLLETRCGRHHP